MTEANEQHPQGDIPIYSAVGFISFEEWCKLATVRDSRINGIILPQLNAEITILNNPVTASFLRKSAQELSNISQIRFGYYNPSIEVPVFCLLDKGIGGERYNLNGNRDTHNTDTLKGAQILIEVLCPEQDIQLDATWDSLFETATNAAKLGYAEVGDSSYQRSIEFSTILPGLSLAFVDRETNRYVSVNEKTM